MGGIKKGAACGRGASYLQKTRDTLSRVSLVCILGAAERT